MNMTITILLEIAVIIVLILGIRKFYRRMSRRENK